jgi:hypothetical protein
MNDTTNSGAEKAINAPEKYLCTKDQSSPLMNTEATHTHACTTHTHTHTSPSYWAIYITGTYLGLMNNVKITLHKYMEW